jgi:nitric oxide reductase subunit C
MPPAGRRALLAVLVLTFVGQTWLVYGDEGTEVRLEGDALAGSQLWHDGGCQTCHQIYGYGGFIGPDLTNLRGRLGAPGMAARLDDVLVTGPGQMPDFGMPPEDRARIGAFLTEMDRTGSGQARLLGGPSGSVWAQAIQTTLDDSGTAAARRGFAAFEARPCQACHVPLAASPVGAPDLSDVTERLDTAALTEVLRSGRAPTMPAPAPAFTPAELTDVVAWFEWMAAHRAELGATEGSSMTWANLPWWEFE